MDAYEAPEAFFLLLECADFGFGELIHLIRFGGLLESLLGLLHHHSDPRMDLRWQNQQLFG